MTRGLRLQLADGQQWVIRPVDDRAVPVVAELSKVMRLGPAETGREMRVAVCEKHGQPAASGWSQAESKSAVLCRLAPPTDRNVRIRQMERIDSAIAHEALARGGLLLHAALAEYQGSGFLMAGPSRTGKSTASRRLPPPWRPLCDDRTLVVQDGEGCFWAHPWPTWSRFRNGGPGGSWAVERAVPLRAVFFIGQSSSEHLAPVNVTQAAALVLDSAKNLCHAARQLTESDPDMALVLCGRGVRAARALAAAVPAYSLKISPSGPFWEEIEQVLAVEAAPESDQDEHDWSPMSVASLSARDSLYMVHTGTDMSPTLHEPDILEVRPYGTVRARKGDVVCFKSPETNTPAVSRIVATCPDGIRTRGDSRRNDDPWVLRQGDIVGRVSGVERDGRHRVVHRGWKGRTALRYSQMCRLIRGLAGRIPHVLYGLLSGLGPFNNILPRSLRPRLVCFSMRYRYWKGNISGVYRRTFLRLLMGGRTVGRYDPYRDKWSIRHPFQLFVDEQTLMRAVAPVLRSEVRE